MGEVVEGHAERGHRVGQSVEERRLCSALVHNSDRGRELAWRNEPVPTRFRRSQNTDSKLLIYRLFQKGRVLAQDGNDFLRSTGVLDIEFGDRGAILVAAWQVVHAVASIIASRNSAKLVEQLRAGSMYSAIARAVSTFLLSVDTSACAALQPTKRSIERFVIHVMQQRSEPSLSISLRCFVHPREIWR